MLKKMGAMLAAAALAAGILCGTAFAQEDDVTGEWYLISMASGGQEFDASMLATFEMSVTLTLNEDGTFVMETTGEEPAEGTYTYDAGAGELVGEESTVPFTVTDGILEAAMDEVSMKFSREMPEAEPFSVADPVEAADLSDFDGVWVGETMVMEGMPIPLEMAGMDLIVTIENGKITAKTIYTSSFTDETEEAEPEETETVYEGVLQDGVLVADPAADSDVYGATTAYLQLREDGRMTMGNDSPFEEEETEAISGDEVDFSFDIEAYIVLVKAE